jgi:hypothetical protein
VARFHRLRAIPPGQVPRDPAPLIKIHDLRPYQKGVNLDFIVLSKGVPLERVARGWEAYVDGTCRQRANCRRPDEEDERELRDIRCARGRPDRLR